MQRFFLFDPSYWEAYGLFIHIAECGLGQQHHIDLRSILMSRWSISLVSHLYDIYLTPSFLTALTGCLSRTNLSKKKLRLRIMKDVHRSSRQHRLEPS